MATPRIARVVAPALHLEPGQRGLDAHDLARQRLRVDGVRELDPPRRRAARSARSSRTRSCAHGTGRRCGSSSARPTRSSGSPRPTACPGRRSPRPPRRRQRRLGPERQPAAGLGAPGETRDDLVLRRPPRPLRGARARLRLTRRPRGRCTLASTAAGSMRWSKAANSSASRRAGPPSGCLATSRGAGVRKLHETPLARAPPVALRSTGRDLTRYSLAIAKRPSGSKTSVRVPTQRHSPGGCGSSRTGTPSCAEPRVRVERDHRLRERDGELRRERHVAFRRAAQHRERAGRRRFGPRRACGRRRKRRALGAPRPRRRQRRLAQRERRRARLAARAAAGDP